MWYVGESRYVYTVVSASDDEDFTITSSTYEVYDCSSVTIAVASGAAVISDHTIYALWTPTAVGTYVAVFSYIIGEETFIGRQVIEVRETI